MKSIVMIAYNFPPDGEAGTYRPLRFVRHLPDAGWQPTVIAAQKVRYERYDPGLLSLITDQVKVVRVMGEGVWQTIQNWRAKKAYKGCFEKSSAGVLKTTEASESLVRDHVRQIVRRVESCWFHPDLKRPWINPAVKATLKVCQRLNPQVIWATGGPWSSFVVARTVSLRTGVPYVLDFRDSWTLAGSPFDDQRPAWAKRRDRRLLYALFQGAQAVIFRYHSEAECYWRAYPGALEVSRIHIIPNGFDGTVQEFDPATSSPTQCKILYAGTITPYRYDTLLQGINVLKKADPSLTERLQVLFVGDGMGPLESSAAKLGISDIVKTIPTVSYAEVCRLQGEASALLLLGLLPIKGHELCGSKVFSYLQAGRPIIGVVPSDEMRSILQRIGVTTIANIDSPSEIAKVFRQVIEAWHENILSTLVPDKKACEVYSAEQQTLALVRALEGAEPNESFVPGAAEIPPSLQEEIGTKRWFHRFN